jgi:putative pyruvate formate lyase activating enzyme
MDDQLDLSNRRGFCRKLVSLASAGLIPIALPANYFLVRYSKPEMADKEMDILTDSEPGFLKLHRSGELRARAGVLWDMMKSCRLCPRECENDRLRGQKGDYCKSTSQLQVSSFSPHFGEEKPLVGKNGSGTVFFTNCGLLCVFCINWEIAQGGAGQKFKIRQLSDMMLQLQRIGCHNINLVTPTHYAPHILMALDHAAAKGLKLPIVYNTSGWEKIEILNLLDGVVDIYLSDFKYFEPEMADKYSPGARSYPEITKKALIEMNRQVGIADPAGNRELVRRGLIIRHLVMPGNVGGTAEVMQWIAGNLPKNTYVNLMSQYRPYFKAGQYSEIARPLYAGEYRDAVNSARKAGLTNLDLQGL